MGFAGRMNRLLVGALRFLHIGERAPACSIASGKIRSCLLFDGFGVGQILLSFKSVMFDFILFE